MGSTAQNDDTHIGLDLPAWRVWVGNALWIAGVVVGIVAVVMTVRLVDRWGSLTDPTADVVMVVVRWVVAAVAIVVGALLASANGRARSRAARETLKQLSPE